MLLLVSVPFVVLGLEGCHSSLTKRDRPRSEETFWLRVMSFLFSFIYLFIIVNFFVGVLKYLFLWRYFITLVYWVSDEVEIIIV